MREFPTILDLIGHTPIIRLPQMQSSSSARVLAKLEYVNPGGSKRDAEVKNAIDAAGAAMVFTGRRHFRH